MYNCFMIKNNSIERDEVFSKALSSIPEFQFDDRVTRVFEDMIKRSVPGYDLLIYMIGLYAQVFVTDDSNVYDLGCSTGVATCMVATITQGSNVNIIAVDNSKSMINQCERNLKQAGVSAQVDYLCRDINEISIKNSSMVILNLTLQFIEPDNRHEILKGVYDGLNEGGVLVLSEKVVFANAELNKSMIDLHQAFKKTQG